MPLQKRFSLPVHEPFLLIQSLNMMGVNEQNTSACRENYYHRVVWEHSVQKLTSLGAFKVKTGESI